MASSDGVDLEAGLRIPDEKDKGGFSVVGNLLRKLRGVSPAWAASVQEYEDKEKVPGHDVLLSEVIIGSQAQESAGDGDDDASPPPTVRMPELSRQQWSATVKSCTNWFMSRVRAHPPQSRQEFEVLENLLGTITRIESQTAEDMRALKDLIGDLPSEDFLKAEFARLAGEVLRVMWSLEEMEGKITQLTADMLATGDRTQVMLMQTHAVTITTRANLLTDSFVDAVAKLESVSAECGLVKEKLVEVGDDIEDFVSSVRDTDVYDYAISNAAIGDQAFFAKGLLDAIRKAERKVNEASTEWGSYTQLKEEVARKRRPADVPKFRETVAALAELVAAEKCDDVIAADKNFCETLDNMVKMVEGLK